jgi:uncharacterized damage-inducible protein DinB
MSPTTPPAALAYFYRGWASIQARLVDVIGPLTPEQMRLRPDADHWAVWQLAANMAGGRAYWFHDVLGEGDPAIRDMFRVAATTVPGLPLEDAGWEDDEDHPRTAAEIVHAFEATWRLVDDCVHRWSEDDLRTEFPRPRGHGPMSSRGWVIWHLIEHELQHGTEIALILRSNGLPTLEL